VDSWSFRMANILVGNEPGLAGLECQYLGPTLKFNQDTVIAVTGANMNPRLDGQPLALWRSLAVKAGPILGLGGAMVGAPSYIAVAGGFTIPETLGSRSTFVKAGVGGIDGQSIKAGQFLPLAGSAGTAGMEVPQALRPEISSTGIWNVEVCAGPNDDW